MSTLRTAALGAALLVVAAANAHAQYSPRTFAVEGNALFIAFQGDGFRHVGDGAGFEALGSVGIGALSLGGGWVRTTHNLVSVRRDAAISGPLAEMRVALPFYYRSFTPYIAARAAHLTSRVDVEGGERRATGTHLGGGLGMLVIVAPSVRINMAATYANMRLRDAELRGERIPDSGANGGNLTLRAGVAIGGASWGVH